MYFFFGSRSARVSGIGVTRSPRSTTVRPMPASFSPMPAMRTADGPMSTPRRPPPRSSGTPMIWTARGVIQDHELARLVFLRDQLFSAIARERSRQRQHILEPQRLELDGRAQGA